MRNLCARLGFQCDAGEVWRLIEFNDVLAFGCGRLLLWTDPQPLPSLGTDIAGIGAAWRLYLRLWNPGKPMPAAWSAHYRAAYDFVTARSAA